MQVPLIRLQCGNNTPSIISDFTLIWLQVSIAMTGVDGSYQNYDCEQKS